MGGWWAARKRHRRFAAETLGREERRKNERPGPDRIGGTESTRGRAAPFADDAWRGRGRGVAGGHVVAGSGTSDAGFAAPEQIGIVRCGVCHFAARRARDEHRTERWAVTITDVRQKGRADQIAG